VSTPEAPHGVGLTVRAGAAQDPEGRPGVASLVATLLDQGTTTRSAEQIANVRKLAHTFIARDGAEAVLMAGTDFSLVFNESNIDFPTIDCARVHIDAIVRRQLG